MRRIIPSLLFLAIGFGAGAAVGQYAAHPKAWVPPAEGPSDEPTASPASAEGARDPKADLETQMMWDPNSHTYQGD